MKPTSKPAADPPIAGVAASHAADALFMIDARGRVTWMNAAAERMFGWTEQELVGKVLHDVVHSKRPGGEAYPQQECPLRAALTSGQALVDHEDVFFGRGGEPIPVSWSNGPVGRGGRVVAAALVVRDLTNRKRLEDRLSREATILERVRDACAAFSRELDREKLLQLVTDQGTLLCGAEIGAFFSNVWTDEHGSYRLHAVSGPLRSAFPAMPGPRVTPFFAPTFQRARVVRAGDVHAHDRFGAWGGLPAGHPEVTSFLAVPVIAHDGEVLGGLLFGHRAPEMFDEEHERLLVGLADRAASALENARLHHALRESEERARAACSAALEANRRKDEFLAMLGHELRNPLAPILTALQLLRLRGAAETCNRELLVIERQVNHLVQLVDDLLDVSRVTGGKIRLTRRPVELADVIARAIEMASPLLEERRHRLDVSVPRAGLCVDGDRARLAQVFANLLTNAAKYTEPCGDISLVAERHEDAISVRVRDTGTGIPADLVPRLFDPFVQSSRTLDRSQGGLGIGLTVVKSLVELHGGVVEAHSEGVGHGSEFTVRLPPISTAIDRPPECADPAAVHAPSPERTRVLVVDDNPDAASMLADALASMGFATCVAHDGPSALLAAVTFSPSVAVLDIGLPVMDGYELARRLREVPGLGAVGLVAVTGYGQESDRERARHAGFDAHLVKPVELDNLRGAIDASARSAGAPAPRPPSEA